MPANKYLQRPPRAQNWRVKWSERFLQLAPGCQLAALSMDRRKKCERASKRVSKRILVPSLMRALHAGAFQDSPATNALKLMQSSFPVGKMDPYQVRTRPPTAPLPGATRLPRASVNLRSSLEVVICPSQRPSRIPSFLENHNASSVSFTARCMPHSMHRIQNRSPFTLEWELFVAHLLISFRISDVHRTDDCRLRPVTLSACLPAADPGAIPCVSRQIIIATGKSSGALTKEYFQVLRVLAVSRPVIQH